MDSFPLRSKPKHLARSISFPSRSHTQTPQLDEHFCKLNETTSSSLSSIGTKLSILEDMYECLVDFLQIPNTQQAFSKNKNCVDEALDGYLMLLDMCYAAKDIFSLIKQHVQGLIFVMRRNGDINESEVNSISKKNANKLIYKSLKDLKNMKTIFKNKSRTIPPLFKEVETATIAALESLLSYVCGSKSDSRLKGLVNKIIYGKNDTSMNEEGFSNGLEKIELGLEFLVRKKTGRCENYPSIENLQGKLAKMEVEIEELEEGLECLFRHLIKIRVYLLNTLAR